MKKKEYFPTESMRLVINLPQNQRHSKGENYVLRSLMNIQAKILNHILAD